MSEVDKAKAISQFRMQLHGVFAPFSKYGQAEMIPVAEQNIVTLALAFHRRLSGEDVPIIAGILEPDIEPD